VYRSAKHEGTPVSPKPLHGIRVRLTTVPAGPFACHRPAHMGADVIKVEAGHGRR
jgi:crotonobetainyl-CoA:carnitine CoA-transferase CaiB-like acyl-CoA transferase